MGSKVEQPFKNPFKPGAGHSPPYLAGRQSEIAEFDRLLGQETILENLVLTGLRGVGKTVLLEKFKPAAIEAGWFWTGTDFSESTSVSETRLALRILADLSVVTASVVISRSEPIGFARGEGEEARLDFQALGRVYEETPGLVADKLKAALELTWKHLAPQKRGLIFAYDEAQNLEDKAHADEYPLSLLLDVFQSIQRKGIPFMLVLTGLPTLMPKLIEARTYAERMFHVMHLHRLDDADSQEAILKPIEVTGCPVTFTDDSVTTICHHSGGYPYFIQFICREVYDVFIQQAVGGESAPVPVDAILYKLDADFFAGRWARATDRQRDLLVVIARLENANDEFTIQEIVSTSAETERPFKSSHVNRLLANLQEAGLVYKNRYGKYSLAVPLFDEFILRQLEPHQLSLLS